MKRIVPFLLSLVLAVAFLILEAGQVFSTNLLDGPWGGKWTSTCRTPGDNASVKLLIQVDPSTRVATVIMFQDVAPPAPSFSSMAVGKVEGDKIIIDSVSSGIPNGASEMSFWLEGPMLLKGAYKNADDCGTFELRRDSNKRA